MPTGKATLIPAIEIAAASRMFAALKTMPPRKALPMFPAEACFRFGRKLHASPPKWLPKVSPETSANSRTPIT